MRVEIQIISVFFDSFKHIFAFYCEHALMERKAEGWERNKTKRLEVLMYIQKAK